MPSEFERFPQHPLEAQKYPQASWAIVRFPGTWSERDTQYALRDRLGQNTEMLWSKSAPDLSPFDAIVLPGGFSYGDYLRTGAMAAIDPIMAGVKRSAVTGTPVIGVCNGFQILCESGMLPGALRKNDTQQFRCLPAYLRVERTDTRFTNQLKKGQVIQVPISHGEGNFWCDEDTLSGIEGDGLVLFRYCTPDGKVTKEANPNGSLHNIAGIMSKDGNVLGMMPHPERVCDPILGGTDGNLIFGSIASSIRDN